MADFRRWFLAFAALVLVLGSAVPASAQSPGPQITCNSITTAQPLLRAEGLTELVGDIVLNCQQTNAETGPTQPPANVPQANITVTIGATLGTPTVSGALDALLLVDDPTQQNQYPCPHPTNGQECTVEGDGGQTFNQSVASGGHNKYNVFQGISGGPGTNSITFLGVPVDPPVTPGAFRTYRITNIRIQGPSVTSGAYGLAPVYAFLTDSGNTSMTINQTSLLPVGSVTPGLKVTWVPPTIPPDFLQCVTPQVDPTPVGAVSFAENFPTAFKSQNVGDCAPTSANSYSLTGCQTTPGQIYYTESGLSVNLGSGEVTGMATTPTQFQTVITGIPAGVSVFVDPTASDGLGTSAVLISPTPIAAGPPAQLTSGTQTSVTAVWAVQLGANYSAYDTLTFGIYAYYTGSAGTGSPQVNQTATESSGFNPQEATAPVPGVAFAGPIPQFAVINYPTPPAVQNIFSVAPCQTVLLFPYVTDYYGFDTGIAISNTSLGASPQTGSCSVAFFGGATAGGPATNIGTTGNTPGFVYSDVSYNGVAEINGTGLIQPGQTWAFSLSYTDSTYNSAPGSGVTGYAIATCNFQFAHGYSFVSDTGIRNFAAAYLALIIPNTTTRYPVPFICSSIACNDNQPGEQLVH